MPSFHASRNRLLALIATILAVAALRASYPVTMPLTLTILLIAAIWPVKLWLDPMDTQGELRRCLSRPAVRTYPLCGRALLLRCAGRPSVRGQ
jgi:hypothetical protein